MQSIFMFVVYPKTRSELNKNVGWLVNQQIPNWDKSPVNCFVWHQKKRKYPNSYPVCRMFCSRFLVFKQIYFPINYKIWSKRKKPISSVWFVASRSTIWRIILWINSEQNKLIWSIRYNVDFVINIESIALDL